MPRSRTPVPAHLPAFLLAGGSSTRMGHDKATLEYHGRTFVDYVIAAVRPLTPRIFIVGDRPDLARYAPVIYDHHPAGPLGAIATALAASPETQALVLAVDMPLISELWLSHLFAAARHSHSPAIVSTDDADPASRLHPLCAVYSRALLPAIESLLAAGERRATEGILAAAGPALFRLPAGPNESLSLKNINTPEDFARLRNP